MRIKCFAIPALAPDEASEIVSRFLAEHRILTVDREFISNGAGSHWAICVTYIQASQPTSQPIKPKRGQVDYREVLSPQDFAVYNRLRKLRKQLAERDGVPAYALFTNEQLAKIVTERFDEPGHLAKISGVGPTRVEKYGEAFIAALKGEGEHAPA